MLSCRECRQRLPEYVEDSEQVTPSNYALRDHLATCQKCRSYYEDLRCVESSLVAYPMLPTPADLTARVMRQISGESQTQSEEWHWLPWDVWLPFAAIFLALLLASFALVQDSVVQGPALTDLTLSTVEWSDSLRTWSAQISRHMEDTVFWAVCTGLFVTLGGLGIAMGLSGLQNPDGEAYQVLSTRVSDVTHWLGDILRRGA